LYSVLYTSLTAKYPKVVFLQVDVVEGSAQAGALAADWDVRKFPHFIFFKRGKAVYKYVAASSEGLRRKIAQHLRRRCA
jgi:suppressor of tumorigenicity protein 13